MPLKPLILVVDDESDMCQLMQRVLESASYDVITATDGSQALGLVTERNPALVLLDINMPGKSGIEVFQELRTSHPNTGVIMATVVGDVKVAVDTLREGAYDYLTKPFNVNQLVISVAGALEKRRLILDNRDYQLNLERKVTEQTQLLEQKVRELTALNNLFVAYLKQGFEEAEAYSRLARSIIEAAGGIQTLAKGAEAREVAGEITKAAEAIQVLAKKTEERKVEVQASLAEKD